MAGKKKESNGASRRVVIVGGVVSPAAFVEKAHETLAASAFPATSFTRGSFAPPMTVAV